MNNQSTEYHLLLQLKCRRKRFGFFRKKIVQGTPYHIEIIIKNFGTDFPGGEISNFQVTYKIPDIGEKYQSSKPIPAIGSGKSACVRIGNFIPLHHGPIWLEGMIQANDHMPIRVRHEGGALMPVPNSWNDSSFIQGRIETLQARTNNLLLFLTALIFLDGAIGLKEI